jgi:hypothetical protein
MATISVWLLVMIQGGSRNYVGSYTEADKCYAAAARAPEKVVSYCIEAKAAFPADAPGPLGRF